MKRLLLVLVLALLAANSSRAQITLTGTSYTQDFNSVSSGLPSGWTVYTSATLSGLGTSASFTNAQTAWTSATSGTDFRNIASSNIAFGSNPTTQNADTSNRALGWRPVGTNAATVQPGREGAVVLTISDTVGFQGFNLSVTQFTANDVSGSQTYALEYRVGSSGNFTSIGTYTTPTTGSVTFNSSTLTASSVTLSALNNQSSSVYIRVRGTSTTGSSSLDQMGIDDFSLTYSAIPEPSAYAAMIGAMALVGAAWHRRRQRQKSFAA